MSGKRAASERMISALNALRCLGVNDEICKEISDAGGMAPCMEIFSSPSDAALVKTTCQTLRQLSCSDAVKADIMKRNGALLFAKYLTHLAHASLF